MIVPQSRGPAVGVAKSRTAVNVRG